MDPRLIDLVWEVHRDVDSSEPTWVVCGYRSPETNTMLRQRSSGVAKFSQHTLGKAMDFYLPGVPLEQLRAVGLYLQRGGVGFYPTSGSPFVHLDTGSVRHWPAIATDQMPHLMAQGQSLHTAAEVASNRRQPAILAKLGGGRAAPDRDTIPAAASRAAPVISLAQIDKPSVVPLPQSKPRVQPATYEVASAESRPVQLRPAQAASLVTRASPSANDIINQRDYWRDVQAPDPANAPLGNAVPRPPAPIPTASVVVASADPEATEPCHNLPLPEKAAMLEPAARCWPMRIRPRPSARSRARPRWAPRWRAPPLRPTPRSRSSASATGLR
jgi:hypothetical protein